VSLHCIAPATQLLSCQFRIFSHYSLETSKLLGMSCALHVSFHENGKRLDINLLNSIVSKYSLYANFLTRYPDPTNPEANLCYALNKLSEEARQ